AVGVPVDDHVGVRKPPPEGARHCGVRTEVAQAQPPQQRLRLFDPPGLVAVDDDDPPARHRHLTSRGPRVQRQIVVAANWLDGSKVRRTASGAMLNTTAIPKTQTCPEPNAPPPITGPTTPPM